MPLLNAALQFKDNTTQLDVIEVRLLKIKNIDFAVRLC